MSEKPAYRDRYACEACGTGYLDCAAGWNLNLKCCANCDGHPERWSTRPAYAPAEIRDMREIAAVATLQAELQKTPDSPRVAVERAMRRWSDA